MVTVPAPTPVTTPDVLPTVANPVLLLVHIPPGTVLVRVVDAPWQTDVAPPIAAGNGVTDILKVAALPQPLL
jgi:hypothetical protein